MYETNICIARNICNVNIALTFYSGFKYEKIPEGEVRLCKSCLRRA